jgi:hypothetical protein
MHVRNLIDYYRVRLPSQCTNACIETHAHRHTHTREIGTHPHASPARITRACAEHAHAQNSHMRVAACHARTHLFYTTPRTLTQHHTTPRTLTQYYQTTQLYPTHRTLIPLHTAPLSPRTLTIYHTTLHHAHGQHFTTPRTLTQCHPQPNTPTHSSHTVHPTATQNDK